jgi:hypothetical protein
VFQRAVGTIAYRLTSVSTVTVRPAMETDEISLPLASRRLLEP